LGYKRWERISAIAALVDDRFDPVNAAAAA
jgi:hypothetical protein